MKKILKLLIKLLMIMVLT